MFVLIAPQNIVGHSILPFLQGATLAVHSRAWEGWQRHVIWQQVSVQGELASCRCYATASALVLCPPPTHPGPRGHAAEMTAAAGAAGKQMILVNPKLGDIQSGKDSGASWGWGSQAGAAGQNIAGCALRRAGEAGVAPTGRASLLASWELSDVQTPLPVQPAA